MPFKYVDEELVFLFPENNHILNIVILSPVAADRM